MIRNKLLAAVTASVAVLGLAACGGSAEGSGGGGGGGGDDTITMGFAQVGAESGWRTANTQSIQESAEAAGIELQFSDAQGEQENQISAIRSFIQQRVDVIAFSPVVETGWDAVLLEAKRANIPVILTDRSVETEQEDLFVTFLGSDFIEEGRKAGEWAVENWASTGAQWNIAELQGTTGAAPAIDRQEGFAEAIADSPNLTIVASQSGDFTRTGGREVMEAMLNSNPDINAVYAHNDDMALGAIEAIEAAGKVPGQDIQIISVDAVRDGMQALADGKINFIVECNPLLGEQLMELAQQVLDGEEVPERVVTEETTFTQEQAAEVLPDRKY
ncbi:ABC transporter substrate-binding protein [Geodermatophilus nigrescens]|uniref:Monosaccharide ABC transporter substrate-binding protein, CUT2 family n=1 Tax=Geodermatophilus nigrescens TaxID=1070870 RepID=A0A1M5QUV7_9ACTN|nr:ABC transporter substrate-binding protein [Geodermatophilus nigrescens]SHH17530.1 monosaccharide ABC transporter substrate-binding protein, CUT2 family [Geodermatophilus nigrescens]